MYKLGINAGAYDGADISKVIPMLSRIGFDSFFTLWSEELPVEKWADVASRNNIKYHSIHGPWKYANEIWNGSEEGKLSVSRAKACIDCCARFDIPIMVVHSFIGFKRAVPTDIGVKLWGEVVEHAEKRNILIGFENLEGEEFLATVMRELGASPAVRFCWDTGHEHCYNLETDMMSLYGDKLIATHLHDNLGCSSESKVISSRDDLHLMPFDGTLDWKRVMDKLRAVSYDGVLTFELKSRDDGIHDRYMGLSCEEFFEQAYLRAVRVATL